MWVLMAINFCSIPLHWKKSVLQRHVLWCTVGNSPLIIAGVASHRFSSDGIGKLSINMVELYARADVPDLSSFKVRYTTAGQDTDLFGKEVPLSGCLATGQYLRVQIWDNAAARAGLNGYGYFFKMDADYLQEFSSVVEGEEYITVYQDGRAVDMYGDSSGQNWYYTNKFAYRKEDTQPTAMYSAADWTMDSLTGLTQNLQGGHAVFPTASITTPACSMPLLLARLLCMISAHGPLHPWHSDACIRVIFEAPLPRHFQ